MSLVYKGSCRLPAKFAYGATTIGCSADGLLFVSTLKQDMGVVPIEHSNYPNWRDWPVASIRNMWDITKGIAGINDMRLGGVVMDGDKVFWNAYQYYNVDGTGRAYWGQYGEAVRTPFRQGGYLALVPPAFRQALGGWIVAGKSNGPGGGNRMLASEGPSVYCAGKQLLSYNLTNPARYGTHAWKGANSVAGLGFTDKHLIFIVRVGYHMGDPYGIPTGAKAACGADKGFYAPPYQVEAWFYNPWHLRDVRVGNLKPWMVQPIQRQVLTSHFVNKYCGNAAGAGYDMATKTFYIAEHGADTSNESEPLPVIHAFGVV